jgi:hypothetical protein
MSNLPSDEGRLIAENLVATMTTAAQELGLDTLAELLEKQLLVLAAHDWERNRPGASRRLKKLVRALTRAEEE